jgi:hypothetical protein
MRTPAILFAVMLTGATGCSSGSTPVGPSDAASDVVTDAGADTGIPCPHDFPDACSMPVPSYKTDIVPIMRMRCAPCHYDGGIEAFMYDFSTYASVDNADVSIQNQVALCEMPPVAGIPKLGVKPAPPLSDAQRVTLFDWLVCGAPNN